MTEDYEDDVDDFDIEQEIDLITLTSGSVQIFLQTHFLSEYLNKSWRGHCHPPPPHVEECFGSCLGSSLIVTQLVFV